MSAPAPTLGGAVPTRPCPAGITAAPGATSSLPVWWSATDWVENEVAGALSPEVLREFHVSARAVLAVARAMAGYADHVTGRDCMPTNDRLVAQLGLSLSTLQRARRCLKHLRLVVETVAGQSVMTYAQRMVAYANGSSHRAIAAVFALCSRRDRKPPAAAVPSPAAAVSPSTSTSTRRSSTSPRSGDTAASRAVDNRRSAPSSLSRDTPPVGGRESAYLEISGGSLRSKAEIKRPASRPAHTQKGERRPAGGPDVRTSRLAAAVIARVGWLQGVHPRRVTPTLAKLARAGWGPRDVVLTIDDVLRTRAWRVPPALDQPAAYLALLLREVDPADRPGALDDHRAAVEAAQRAYARQLVDGPRCPHGQPGGALRSPVRHLQACPACRAAAAADVEWPAVVGPALSPANNNPAELAPRGDAGAVRKEQR